MFFSVWVKILFANNTVQNIGGHILLAENCSWVTNKARYG